MLVVDPATPTQAVKLLDQILAGDSLERPCYFRLRRTPSPELFAVLDKCAGGKYSLSTPLLIPAHGPDDASTCLVSIGTVPTKLAWDCQTAAPSFAGAPVVVVSALNHAVDAPFWAGIFAKYKTIVVIEDDIGALYKFVCTCLAEHGGVARPRVVSKTVPAHGPSQRTMDACLQHFGFTPAKIEELYKSAL
jgi:hypothetical protein